MGAQNKIKKLINIEQINNTNSNNEVRKYYDVGIIRK